MNDDEEVLARGHRRGFSVGFGTASKRGAIRTLPRVQNEKRVFQCFFKFLNWYQWSLGIHIDPQHPHLDLHLLSGFFRIGWYSERVSMRRLDRKGGPAKDYGWTAFR